MIFLDLYLPCQVLLIAVFRTGRGESESERAKDVERTMVDGGCRETSRCMLEGGFPLEDSSVLRT